MKARHGMSLREAEKLARKLSATVEPVRGTGEHRVSHSAMKTVVTINSRRKDAPRALTSWLTRLIERLSENAA